MLRYARGLEPPSPLCQSTHTHTHTRAHEGVEFVFILFFSVGNFQIVWMRSYRRKPSFEKIPSISTIPLDNVLLRLLDHVQLARARSVYIAICPAYLATRETFEAISKAWE